MSQCLKPDEYLVEHSYTSCWVNTASSCIGRFGQMGIDIHRPIEEQVEGQSECLHCTHGPTTVEHWYEFVAKMAELYGVVIDSAQTPGFIREKLFQENRPAVSSSGAIGAV